MSSANIDKIIDTVKFKSPIFCVSVKFETTFFCVSVKFADLNRGFSSLRSEHGERRGGTESTKGRGGGQ